jgi:Ca2+-binding EF-hand superfamily protein
MKEFIKVMEAFGCTFKEPEIQALFNKFDLDKSGKLDYEEFASFFARLGTGNNPNVPNKFPEKREPPNSIIDKVKKTLVARGGHGIRGLGRVFRRMDDGGDRKLDRYEFEWGLKENGHTFSKSELDKLFKFFDKNHDGVVSYDEFLRAIRGNLNDKRKALVNQVFKKLDKTGDGYVTFEDCIDSYNVEHHPKFSSGEMSKKEILEEFMSQWDTLKKDGIIHPEEFQDYYAVNLYFN